MVDLTLPPYPVIFDPVTLTLLPAQMVRRYAHFSVGHLATYAEKLPEMIRSFADG
jgi:hypothetical protein